MLQGGACRLPVILEDQNVLEAAILLEIDDAVAESPKHVLDAFLRHVGEGLRVIRRLDNDFMRTDAVHAVVHTIGAAIEVSFDPQCGIFVGHYTHGPAGLITLTLTMAKGKDLRWRLGFVAGTERAKSALENYGVSDEITWSARAVGRNNDPASGDGVLPQFGQLGSSPRSESSFYDIWNASLNRVISLDPLLSRYTLITSNRNCGGFPCAWARLRRNSRARAERVPRFSSSMAASAGMKARLLRVFTSTKYNVSFSLVISSISPRRRLAW